MRNFFKWVVSGLGFAIGLACIAFLYEIFLNLENENVEYFQDQLKGKLEIVDVNPTKSEDRLTFNALVKNFTSHHFGYTWLRFELYDADGEFLRSCDGTTSNFAPNSERWTQTAVSYTHLTLPTIHLV